LVDVSQSKLKAMQHLAVLDVMEWLLPYVDLEMRAHLLTVSLPITPIA